MFRTLCQACEAKAIAQAAQSHGTSVFAIGCEHEHVAATIIADGGLIVQWTTWPAPTAQAYAQGAAAQLSVMQTVIEEARSPGDSTKH